MGTGKGLEGKREGERREKGEMGEWKEDAWNIRPSRWEDAGMRGAKEGCQEEEEREHVRLMRRGEKTLC